MKTKYLHRSDRGSTIIEAVLATGVIGVMGTALIGCFSYGFFNMQLVRENQRATQIILEKVETIRLYSWDQIGTPGFIPATFTEVYDPQGASGSTGLTYNGTLTITNVPFSSNYSDHMRQMIITLSWTTGNNVTRSRTLATLVARDGIQNYVF